MEEKILVSPGEGQTLEDLAKGLLAVAEDPHDVDYSPRTGGFTVPESLAARYGAAAAVTAVADAQARAARSARATRSRASSAKGAKAAAATGETAKAGRGSRSRKPAAAKASPAAAKTQAKGAAKGDEGGGKRCLTRPLSLPAASWCASPS